MRRKCWVTSRAPLMLNVRFTSRTRGMHMDVRLTTRATDHKPKTQSRVLAPALWAKSISNRLKKLPPSTQCVLETAAPHWAQTFYIDNTCLALANLHSHAARRILVRLETNIYWKASAVENPGKPVCEQEWHEDLSITCGCWELRVDWRLSGFATLRMLRNLTRYT